MKRLGKPEEISRAVLFLLSEEASFIHKGAIARRWRISFEGLKSIRLNSVVRGVFSIRFK